jgi:hypothetical protein
MNKQNFKNGNAMFPISTDALEFMQEQNFLVARLAELAGPYVIISQPANGKAGLCVFDGELLPLSGDAAATHIGVTEVKTDITAHGTTYRDARVTREAVYGTSGAPASSFIVLDNMAALKSAIADLTTALNTEATTRARHDIPKGTVIDWYGTIVVSNMPDSFLPCGKIVVGSLDQVRTEQTLWQNKMHGGLEFAEGYNGNGYYYRIKSWNGYTIPDLTDRFIVQAGGEYSLGKTGGEKEHKLTVREMPSHSHEVTAYVSGSNGYDKFGIISDRDVTTPKTYTPLSDTGGNIAHENRPPFFALYKLIKVI